MFRSVAGVQQGNLLDPLLFRLALDEALRKLKGAIRELENPDITQNTAMSKILRIHMCHLGDGILIGSLFVLRTVLEFFSLEEAKGFGFHVRSEKCSVRWPFAGGPPRVHA